MEKLGENGEKRQRHIRLNKALKSLPKQSVLRGLEMLVHWRLAKIEPEIIGITGSVGKTSTKEAITTVVSSHIPTYCSPGSYNTEFGAMLAILGQESGYSSPLKWMWALMKGLWGNLMLENKPYKALIVEMGADKPGDIEYLLRHIHPTIGVLCNVKAIHTAEGQFADAEAVLKEKAKLIHALPREGWAILNVDDARVARVAADVDCRVILFGTSAKADLRAEHVKSGVDGLHFTLSYDGKSHQVHLPELLGEHHVYVVLPAIAMGFLKGMPFEKIAEALKKYQLPPGRMSRLEGLNGSIILDSSYNASPDTVLATLGILNSMPGRKIAALGSMNELGEQSEAEHRRIGRKVSKVADLLITVGADARFYAEEARAHGMSKEVMFSFETSQNAGEFLKGKLKNNDVVLAKGSQNNVRMEHLVRAIMAHPEEAPRRLPRQGSYWQNS